VNEMLSESETIESRFRDNREEIQLLRRIIDDPDSTPEERMAARMTVCKLLVTPPLEPTIQLFGTKKASMFPAADTRLDLTQRQQDVLAELMGCLAPIILTYWEACAGRCMSPDGSLIQGVVFNWIAKFGLKSQEIGELYDIFHRRGRNG